MASEVDMSRCETVHRGGCQCFAEENELRARLHDAEQDRDNARSQAEALAEDVRRLVEERDEARAALEQERRTVECWRKAAATCASCRRAEAAEARWSAEHATALEALRQAEAAEARVAELQATAVAPEPEAKDAATLAFDAIARAVGCPEWDYPGQLVRDVERLRKERDEARAALAKMEEEHRAAVEALEMYESRIGDIADHVLGLVPPDVPSVVKLDAIERRCGEERVAARQAEARVAELEAMRDVLGSTVQQADGVIIRGSERIAVLERIADAAAALECWGDDITRTADWDRLRDALAARGKDGAR